MSKMTGKQALAEMLLAEGTKYVFGNPGTTESPLLDVLQDYKQLEYIVALQEGTAVGMADAYARATGKPAFANLHIAGGLANGVSALYNAYQGGAPLVLTAGQSDTRAFITEPFLSGNLVEMVKQFTKWSVEVLHASDLPIAIRRAFKEAKTPPTGPVFISFPWNSMDEVADVDIVPSGPLYPRIRPDSEALAKSAQLLAKAKNPILMMGDRVARAEAIPEAVRLAELVGARVYSVGQSELTFPTGHPQFAGTLNVNSTSIAERLAKADVILAAGSNVFSSFLYLPEPIIGKSTKLIHLDNHSKEIEKIYPTEVGMLADPKAGMEDLIEALESVMSGSAREAAKNRAASMGERRQKVREAFQARVKKSWDNRPISLERMMTELADVMPENGVLADESVTSRPTFLQARDFNEPGGFFRNAGGALGWGVPGALGVQMAMPDRPVLGMLGDGASMYTIQALWTAAKYNIPVKYVICNNGTYKILRLNMELYLREMLGDQERQSEYVGMDFGQRLEIHKIAEGMGVEARRVEEPSDLRPAFEWAFSQDRPTLVDVVIAS